MTIKTKEQMIKEYLEFKKECIDNNIFNLKEIWFLFKLYKEILGDLING